MRNGSAGDAAKIRTVVMERAFHSVESRDVLRSVEASGGLARTRAIAEEYAVRAQRLLEVFPRSPFRDAIAHTPEFILNRTS